jgi:TolB protein
MVEDSRMIYIPKRVVGRRALLAGAAGSMAALAVRVPVHAQPAPPAALPAPGGPPPAQGNAASAVIDVNRARVAPIPIAIPDFAGPDGDSAQIGRNIAAVITNDLGNCGLFQALAPASFAQQNLAPSETPNFQNWSAIGARALVSGGASVQGGNIRVEFRLWDVLPQAQIQGTAYTTSQSNWRRIAHIIADVIYERLLGEKGYFDTRVAYVSATGPRDRRTKRLAIMDQDSENNRFLTDGSWLVLTPRFRPTGDEIAYMSYANNRPRVYLFNLGSGHQTVLGDFSGMTFAPRFSPDGSTVIMSVTRDLGSEIVSVELGSHSVRRLTDSSSINVSPCFSPDGSQVVFASDRDGDQQIYVMNADGSGVKRVSFGHARYGEPVWSPRGDLVAFTRYAGDQSNFAIGVMQPDGMGERTLSEGWLVEGSTFCPNGRVIMFWKETPGSRGAVSSQLMSVDITGFNERIVTTPTAASDPAWSPLGA